jgi:hypothetical protein
MLMLDPLRPSSRTRVPWSFVGPRTCLVIAFVRPRFGTAPIEWHLAIVDPLLVARLGAEPLLPGASRLDVTVAAISAP